MKGKKRVTTVKKAAETGAPASIKQERLDRFTSKAGELKKVSPKEIKNKFK